MPALSLHTGSYGNLQHFRETIQRKVLEGLRKESFFSELYPGNLVVPRFPKHRCFCVSSRSHSRWAQSIQFLPITVLLSFSLSALTPGAYLFESDPPLLCSGSRELLATVTPMPLSADLLCSWRVSWQKVIGAWTYVSLCTRKKKSVTLFKACSVVFDCLKILQGKPSVYFWESGCKMAKPHTGGGDGVGIRKKLSCFGSLIPFKN